MTWFETKSTGLLRIFIMPRIMQVLCSREAGTTMAKFPTVVKAVKGGSRELFSSISEQEVGSKAAAGSNEFSFPISGLKAM